MKIGIITFHWATNYGAILQAYCLQEYLQSQGHNVEIINYKPKQYDFSWLRILSHPRMWRYIIKYILDHKKEKMLAEFRCRYLKMTERYYTDNELLILATRYNVIFTGSDQILNPYFATRGENGNTTSAYYLGFVSEECKRIGYAVSFGCTTYPDEARTLVEPWIKNFDAISVRENTGMDILEELNFRGFKQVVPDPTILFGKQLYSKLGVEIPLEKDKYTCVYMLRKRVYIHGDVVYIDETHTPLSMKSWLSAISHAKRLITNSYHGMIMAILSHVPFVVLAESGNGAGMNDRFITLLSAIGLEDRVVTSIDEVNSKFMCDIDFNKVDKRLALYQQVGVEYIKKVTK